MSYSLKDVCMVVVTFNPERECISRINTISKYITKIFVIDNGSSNCLENELIEGNPRISIIYNKKNMGIAYALNQGLDLANRFEYPLLITMDQDSIIEIDSIRKMVESIDISQGIVSVGPFYDENEHVNNESVSCLITSGNLLHVQTIKSLGGFNNALFIDCVDIDLSFKILVNGYKLQQISYTYMKHKIGEYENSPILKLRYLSHKPYRYFYKIRNNIYIYKVYGRKLPVLCVKLFCSCLLEIFKVVFIEKEKKEKLKYSFCGFKQGIGIDVWNNKIL